MPSPPFGAEPRIEEIIGDADIHDILSHRLMPSGFSGRETEKFLVDGHPDIVIRTSPDLRDINEVRYTQSLTRRMQPNGVHMPLFASVEHADGIFVVTERVTGAELTEAVSADTPNHILAHVDRTYAGLALSLTASAIHRTMAVDDIDEPHQYMLGTTPRMSEPDVLLVDFPIYANRLNDWPFTLELPRRLMHLARYAVDLELLSNQRLTNTRAAIQAGLVVAQDPTNAPEIPETAQCYILGREGYIDVARHILATQEQVDVEALDHPD